MHSINPSTTKIAPWLDSKAALALLGIRPQSLYANVSRGRIRAKADPCDPRRRLYSSDDVLKLALRNSGAEPARNVARRAVAWGEPVLGTALSTVADGRLYYCGRSVEDLAQEGFGLEQVSAILWGCDAVSFDAAFSVDGAATGAGLRQALACIAAAAADSRPMPGRAAVDLRIEAAALVGSIARSWIGCDLPAAEAMPMHERLALGWARPESASVIRQALVLLADHELNASTFAARVTASTGASLAAAVLAGLATLTGPMHGGASAELSQWIDEALVSGPEAAVRTRLQQGRHLPAFGHPFYPDGDPRATRLLQACAPPEAFAQLAAEAARQAGALPNVDFALAALAAAHRLPPEAPLAIFAVARSVGWIAHAMEQARTRALIRPRAWYEGPALSR
jgi:citrate synthase